MKQNNKKTLIISFSIVIGIFIGLILASNFDMTQIGMAENKVVSSEAAESSVSSEFVPLSNSDLENTSRAFVAIAKKVTPTIVSITSEKVIKVRDPFSNLFNDDFFRRFFRGQGRRNGEQEYRQQGLGSGVIVSPEGYIITNYHVIKDADEIEVVWNDKTHPAKVIGTDSASDIAVIKIDKKNLPAIALGNSDKLEVGEWVLAIGSPFNLRLEHTVTSGIISAKGRSLNLSNELTYQDFIQTDAAINPGNSGGALVNIHGELIGINSAIYAGSGGGNIGIGFAIPINLAKRVMDDLIVYGKVVRGYLGVVVNTPDDEMAEALGLHDHKGALVQEVQKGTPADKAGLKRLDVIVELDGKKVEDHYALTNMIGSYAPGSRIRLKIIRDGRPRRLEVALDERPGFEEKISSQSHEGKMLERLGLELSNLTDRLAERYDYEGEEGVLVTNVRRGSIAEEKQIRAGDLIKEVNRKIVTSVKDVKRIVEKLPEGKIVLFQIRRGSRNQFIAMRVPKR
ncbi:MAG: Do family serine endopeptidase [bacterium]